MLYDDDDDDDDNFKIRSIRILNCDEEDVGRVRFNVPPNTLYVISGTGFYGTNDPTDSVKALKEDGS